MKKVVSIESLLSRKQELETRLDLNESKLENMWEHESKREMESIYFMNDNICEELNDIEEQLEKRK